MTTRRSVLRTLAGLPLVAGATTTLLASMLADDPRVKGSMWIYLWDIVDEGYDAVMARLKENLPLLAAAVRARFDGQPPQAVFQQGDDRIEIWDYDHRHLHRGEHGIRSAADL